jgi:hypothetical protein
VLQIVIVLKHQIAASAAEAAAAAASDVGDGVSAGMPATTEKTHQAIADLVVSVAASGFAVHSKKVIPEKQHLKGSALVGFGVVHVIKPAQHNASAPRSPEAEAAPDHAPASIGETSTARSGITIFSIPRSFEGSVGDRQLTAVASWLRIVEVKSVMLFVDDPLKPGPKLEDMFALEPPRGEVSEDEWQPSWRERVKVIGVTSRNDRGTPFLDAVFETAQAQSSTELLAFVNSDMVFFAPSFWPSIRHVASRQKRFLMSGRRTGLSQETLHRTDLLGKAKVKRSRPGGSDRGFNMRRGGGGGGAANASLNREGLERWNSSDWLDDDFEWNEHVLSQFTSAKLRHRQQQQLKRQHDKDGGADQLPPDSEVLDMFNYDLDQIDYFIFPRPLWWPKMPQFVAGRVRFDNWLVGSAIETSRTSAGPTAAAEAACAGDYGQKVGDSVCCGQEGVINSAEVICSLPGQTCRGFEQGVWMGTCGIEGAAAAAAVTASATLAATLPQFKTIDASSTILSIHQNHNHSHHTGGFLAGAEAQWNMRIGSQFVSSIRQAPWSLRCLAGRLWLVRKQQQGLGPGRSADLPEFFDWSAACGEWGESKN